MNNQQSVNSKQAAKIGLFSAIMILISAIIGVGIFFKNKSVFDANNYNPIGVIVSWVIAFIIVIATAICFIEIISADKSNSNAGLASWTRKMCGHKLGRFTLIQLPLFYYALKLLDTSLFTSESIFNIFKDPTVANIGQPSYAIILLAIAVICIFVAINCVSIKAGKTISITATFLKFLPLILVGVLGISFGIVKNTQLSLFDPNYVHIRWGEDAGEFDIVGVFACLPALLFAFDSFLIIGNTSKNMIKPERNVPLAVVIAVPCVACLYLLVTLGQVFTGSPDVYTATSVIVSWLGGNKDVITAFNVVVGVFISIALFGVMNSFALTSIRSLQSAIDENVIIGSHKIKSWTHYNEIYGGVIMTGFICTIFMIIIATPTIILNTDSILDGVSNFPALFFFGMYSIIIAFGLINHFNEKIKVRRMKIFPFVAIIAIIGCAFVLGYNLFYEFFVHAIIDPNQIISWGMFKKEAGLTRWVSSIIFWIGFIIFISMPFINDILINKFRKVKDNTRLIWQ